MNSKFDPNLLGLGETIVTGSPEDFMKIEIEVKFKGDNHWYTTQLVRQELHNIINERSYKDIPNLERIMLMRYDGDECSIRCEFVLETGQWEFV